jgi:hypothetical protein
LLFIIPPLKIPGIAAHSCLRASGNSQLTEAIRQGRLRSQDIFARLKFALTERGETAGPVPFVICQRSFVICHLSAVMDANDE